MGESDPKIQEGSRIKGEPLSRCPGPSVRDLALADTNPVPEFLYTDVYENLGSEPIPAARYTDPAFFELENQKMWPRVWQFAAREEEPALKLPLSDALAAHVAGDAGTSGTGERGGHEGTLHEAPPACTHPSS